MLKKKNRRGFTMAEMLIVVAIIGVLAAVSFVVVNQRQRDLARLERDATAREIFVAAQNHLTMAESQGFMGLEGEGIFGTAETGSDGVYYFAYPGNGYAAGAPATLLDLMLPFGAVDETVRGGGSYIIRYQAEAARVLDVFYCSNNGDRYDHVLTGSEYTENGLLDNYTAGKESDRRNYSGKVLGWYGGEAAQELVRVETPLEAPEIEIVNAETLFVRVTDKNAGSSIGRTDSLELIVKGLTSGVQKSFTLLSTPSSVDASPRVSGPNEGIYIVMLDDITQPLMHFADLTETVTGSTTPARFLPGEDISVQAVAFDNTKLSNIAYSAEKISNSLFERVVSTAPTGTTSNATGAASTAYINNFRHLENLDSSISNVDNMNGDFANVTAARLNFTRAVQSTELDWSAFPENINSLNARKPTRVYKLSETDTVAAEETDMLFVPVNPNYPTGTGSALAYDGQEHIIRNVKAVSEVAGESVGLFGKPTVSMDISNLALIDFEISGAGDAGALVGTLDNASTVTNVLAYNSETNANFTNIQSTGGNAGGLIGSMTGGSVAESAAALYVSAGTNAGGLIGKTSGVAITGSYSGGHTLDSLYSDNTAIGDAGTKGLVNVICTATDGGTAGGLLGDAFGCTVKYCYATCSVYSQNGSKGGLIGNASSNNVTVERSYAAGLVKAEPTDQKAGTFLGSGALSRATNCYYIPGINDGMASGPANTQVQPFGATDGTSGNAALTLNQTRYSASPYDVTLIATFAGEYGFLTVKQLGYTPTSPEQSLDLGNATTANAEKEYKRFQISSRHYGDWQMPAVDYELLINNAERLTATVSLPEIQAQRYLDNWEAFNIYLLIVGEQSKQVAYLPFKLTEPATTGSAGSGAAGGAAGAQGSGGTAAPYVLAMDAAREGQVFVPGIDNANITTWMANSGVKVALTGETAGAKTLSLSIRFDSVTDNKEGHFANLFPTFIPGENLTVVAAAGVSTQDMLTMISNTPEKWNVVRPGAAQGNAADATADGEAGSETQKSEAQADAANAGDTDVSANATPNDDTAAVGRTIAGRTNSLFFDPAPQTPSQQSGGDASGTGETEQTQTQTGTEDALVEYTDVKDGVNPVAVAAIGNFRHLENLDGAISKVNAPSSNATNAAFAANANARPGAAQSNAEPGTGEQTASTTVTYTQAAQVLDLSAGADETDPNLSWSGFVSAIKAENTVANAAIKVYNLMGDKTSEDDAFLPVSPGYALTYDGQGHAISGVVVGKRETAHTSSGDGTSGVAGGDTAAANAAGLFGAPANPFVARNVALIDFYITGAGDTGALAGKLTATADKKSTVMNVVAYNTDEFETANKEVATVLSTGGSAGGLIGSTIYTDIEGSAAALIVEAKAGNAGGLVGTSVSGSVKNAYAGGHCVTDEATGAVGYSKTKYNVTASGIAGGLIGGQGTTQIEASYSTCSVKGATAGGFVGSGTGTISKCYATGLVSGTTASGAFTGSTEATNLTGCWYYEIINEKEPTADDFRYTYLPPVAGTEGGAVTVSDTQVKALDADAATYNAFTGASDSWITADPYNGKLSEYYSGYNLMDVVRLAADGAAESGAEGGDGTDAIPTFVSTHYGDWPAPEIFVINE